MDREREIACIVVVSVSNRAGEIGEAEMITALETTQERLSHSLHAPPAVVLDLSGAEFLTEDAIASLFILWREIESQGITLALAGLTSTVKHKLLRLGCLPLLADYSDVDAARTALMVSYSEHY